jgi:hypothetical protein
MADFRIGGAQVAQSNQAFGRDAVDVAALSKQELTGGGMRVAQGSVSQPRGATRTLLAARGNPVFARSDGVSRPQTDGAHSVQQARLAQSKGVFDTPEYKTRADRDAASAMAANVRGNTSAWGVSRSISDSPRVSDVVRETVNNFVADIERLEARENPNQERIDRKIEALANRLAAYGYDGGIGFTGL